MSSRKIASRAIVSFLAVAMLLGSRARAQERDPAAAEALFAEGRALMNAQRYAQACTKLAESQRLDPSIGTEFHLAVCYEHAGKLASAWAGFLEVASLATASGQQERARAATRRASLLEARLPRLKITVPAASRTAGLEITRDGVVVGPAQWDVALPVDPGDHQLEVTAPERRALAATVAAAEGASVAFEVPQLENATVATAHVPDAASPVAAPAPIARQPPQQPASPPQSAQQPPSAPQAGRQTPETSSGPGAAVIGLGIGGVVAIGVGTVLGLLASSKNKQSKSQCDPKDETRCSDTGVSLRNKAFVLSDVASVGFIAGGAALASAAVLWLLSGSSDSSPHEAPVALDARPGVARLVAQGKF
jgi:serine/threonine-protein kinase